MLKPPPPQQYGLGALHASYRDYGTLNVCRVDPATVEKDQDELNGLLASFLQNTSQGKTGLWSDEQRAALKDGEKTLAPILDQDEKLLERLATCPVESDRPGTPLPEQVEKGKELIRQTRLRIGEAPSLYSAFASGGALSEWKKKALAEQESERGNWCPPKPSKIPEVFFAWEDEDGTTEWLFCDGSKVTRTGKEEPRFVASTWPAAKRPAKPVPAATYLGSATTFPASEIRHAPKSAAGH